MDPTGVPFSTRTIKRSSLKKKREARISRERVNAYISETKLRDQLMMEADPGGTLRVPKRLLLAEMRRRGIRIPKFLDDSIVKKSKKGRAGQILVRASTGVQKNAAAELVRRFETNVGGKEDVVEKLSAIQDALPESVKGVLAVLASKPTMKLPRAIAEAGADIAQVMSFYAKGAIFLGQTESAIEAQRNMPRVVKDLVGHALDKSMVCSVCFGTRTVSRRKGEIMETETCPMCRGEGATMTSSKHKEFAVQKLLEITKMVEKKGPLVEVNQQVGVKVGGEAVGGALAKVSHLADEILYGRKALPTGDIVEGEVVK